MKYKIRELIKDDIDNILVFYEKYLGKNDWMNKTEILKRLDTNTGIFLVATNTKNEIVGIKFAYLDNGDFIGRGIAVSPEFRRYGVGKSLVKEFEKRAKKMSPNGNYYFGSATPEGVPFHIKMGYEPSVLIQYTNPELRSKIDLTTFEIESDQYNEQYKIHQIYIKIDPENQKLEYLQQLKLKFPEVGIQYFFKKPVKDM